MAWLLNLLSSCFGFAGFGEELFKDWENHPAAQQYTFLKRLGEGGFSEVQLARDDLTGKTVALKIVFLNKAGLKPEEKRILGGEAKLLRMVAHPNIIRCSRILETQRQQVLVLEHLSGGEMLQQLQRVKRYTEAHACQLFRQIVDAVAYLHSLGIMHRDIKPENCLLAKPASHYKAKSKPVKVKLIDLGMAGLYRPRRPLYGCMGSPGFIAPEVVVGEAHAPGMDVYSLGVLLFVMLVGRKPWDAQRSHTLQYAVEATADAPGLQDPIFTALSPAAQQLVMLLLAEEPGDRPSAADVLNHAWMLQGIKAPADGSPAVAPERLIQPAVQQRLNMLAHSRQIMGTARGMMLLHGRGSRSNAVAFHKAVKEARNKLQQQAAVLKAAGQIQGAAGAPHGAADDTAGENSGGVQQRQLTPFSSAAAATAVAAGGTGRQPSTAGNGATAVNRPGPGVTASLARPVSYADPKSAAAQFSAAGDLAAANGPLGLRRKSAIGDLARASLQQQSLLFTGPQRPPAVRAAAAAAAAAGHASSAGHVPTARSASDEAPTAGTRVGVGAHYRAPDTAMVAQDLARGMSVPEPDLPFSMTNDYQAHRFERAVTLSPGALALLDADDRMCLLAASQDDDESAAFFSWGNRRGAADMLQSFKERYPIKQAALPLVRNLAKLGASLGRSLRHSVGSLGSHQDRRFSPRATRLGSEDTSDGFTTPRPATAATTTTTDGLPSPRHSTALLLSADSGEVLSQDFELVSVDDATQQQQLRRSGDGGSSGGATRSLSKTAGGRCADQLPARSSNKKHEQPTQAQQQSQQQVRNSATAASNAARRSTSASEALELAFLGTQLSISPTLSPLTSVTAATSGLRNSSDDGSKQAVEYSNPSVEALRAEPGTPKPIRPAGAAVAAAAANKHFRQQHHGEQQGKQQGRGALVTAAQHLPPIPFAKSPNTALSASGTISITAAGIVLLDENARAGQAGVTGDQQQEQQQQQKIAAKHPPKHPSREVNPAAAAPAAAAAAAQVQHVGESAAAAAVLTLAMASKQDLLKGGSSIAGTSSRKGPASSAATPKAASTGLLASAVIHSAVPPPATAAKYEEESLNLPNGLWLQQSPHLSETGLLSPQVALATGFTAGLGLELTAAASLSSAAESLRTLGMQDSMLNVAFAESQLSDYSSGDYTATPHTAGTEAAAAPEVQQRSTRSSDADPWSQQQELELLREQQGIVTNNQSAGDSQHVQYSKRSAAERHKRDLSINDWLDPEQSILAWPLADGYLSTAGSEWSGNQQAHQAPTTEAQGAIVMDEKADSSSVQRKQSSRSQQVAVPHSVAASSTRHSPGKSYRHQSDHQLKLTGPQRATSSEDSPELLAALHAAASGAAVAGDVGSKAMEEDLGQSIGAEGPDLGFYVGSYSNAQGLASQRDSEAGLDETVGSLGLNSDENEDCVVGRLRHATEEGWDDDFLPAAETTAPGRSKVVAATAAKALLRSLTANGAAAAAAVRNGRSTSGRAGHLGQGKVNSAQQLGLDETEIMPLEQPLTTSNKSHPNPSPASLAVAPVAVGTTGNGVKAAATASDMQVAGRLPPGRLTVAVGATRIILGKQGSGALTSGSSMGNSELSWPASGTNESSNANGALQVQSNQKEKPQLHENVRNSSPPRSIPIVKGNKRISGRRVGVHPVYDAFDESTAW